MLQVAHGCPELRSLFWITERWWAWGRGPCSELLEACPCLPRPWPASGQPVAPRSGHWRRQSAAPFRAPRPAVPRVRKTHARPLPDEAWAALSRRHPGLEVELELEPVLPAEGVTARPAAGRTGGCAAPQPLWGHRRPSALARHCATTFAPLRCAAAASAELDAALEELAARCAGLREVHCFCVVRPSVLHAFRARCPAPAQHAQANAGAPSLAAHACGRDGTNWLFPLPADVCPLKCCVSLPRAEPAARPLLCYSCLLSFSRIGAYGVALVLPVQAP